MITKILDWLATKVFRMDPLVQLAEDGKRVDTEGVSKDAYVCRFDA